MKFVVGQHLAVQFGNRNSVKLIKELSGYRLDVFYLKNVLHLIHFDSYKNPWNILCCREQTKDCNPKSKKDNGLEGFSHSARPFHCIVSHLWKLWLDTKQKKLQFGVKTCPIRQPKWAKQQEEKHYIRSHKSLGKLKVTLWLSLMNFMFHFFVSLLM